MAEGDASARIIKNASTTSKADIWLYEQPGKHYLEKTLCVKADVVQRKP